MTATFKRRFIFHGTAAAFGGRIVRPADITFEPSCAASLPATGGRSTARRPGGNFGDVVRFGPARAHAEGVFDDFDQAVELTYGRLEEQTMTTSTTVTAEIEQLAIDGKPALTVERLRGTLRARSAAQAEETPISLVEDTVIENVALDGHRLLVDLNFPVFQLHNTRAKLITVAKDPKFVRDHGPCFFFPPRGVIHATIVRSLRWDGAPYPGAQLDQHSVAVPDLGRIFFGEMLIDASLRRLTMMRVEFNSAVGGCAAFAEVETSGVWFPSAGSGLPGS